MLKQTIFVFRTIAAILLLTKLSLNETLYSVDLVWYKATIKGHQMKITFKHAILLCASSLLLS